MNHIMCSINGCGQDAAVIDDVSGLPVCWDCIDELDAVRAGNVSSMWDVAQDGFRLGLFAGMFSNIFGSKG